MGQGTVLKLLQKKGLMCTRDICKIQKNSQSSVSNSIKRLLEQGLVEMIVVKERKKLPVRYYRVVPSE